MLTGARGANLWPTLCGDGLRRAVIDLRRSLSALSWLVVAGILVRAASGGGISLGSFRYVSDREPPLSYAAGAALLAASLVLVAAFVRSRSPAVFVASGLVSIPAFLYAAYMLNAHNSALGLGGAALVAFILAAPAARQELARRRGASPPAGGTDTPNARS
jgi:hypothetical protein